MPLTPKRAKFVAEYLSDGNATQAAVRAGYSPRSANTLGPRLLGTPEVAAAIRTAQEARGVRMGVSSDEVLHEIALVAFSSIADYALDAQGQLAPATGKSPDVMRALERGGVTVKRSADGLTVSTEIKLWDKIAGLRLAGQHLGLCVPVVVVVPMVGAGLSTLLAQAKDAAEKNDTP